MKLVAYSVTTLKGAKVSLNITATYKEGDDNITHITRVSGSHHSRARLQLEEREKGRGLLLVSGWMMWEPKNGLIEK